VTHVDWRGFASKSRLDVINANWIHAQALPHAQNVIIAKLAEIGAA
jgi:hypothetical protein